MIRVRNIVLGLGLAASAASAGEYARLSGAFQEFPTPREGLQYRAPALAYIRGDSVFLAAEVGSICPVCTNCPCGKTFRMLDSFPLAPEHRGLPLQQAVRLQANDTGLFFLALGHGNVLRRRAYRYAKVGGYAEAVTLIRADTLALRLTGAPTETNNTLILYGIDSLGVDSQGRWRFRVFGNHSVRGAAYLVTATAAGPHNSVSLARGTDTLTVISSGGGIYGTKEGYVLDPVPGYANPLPIAPQPIVFVNDSGAAGDRGLFALRTAGGWRVYPRADTLAYRDFQLLPGPSSNAWTGISVRMWDNRFRVRESFVKDDSTTWAGGAPTLRTYAGAADSASFTLADPDGNYGTPALRLQRAGTSQVQSVWGDFRPGCWAGVNDTLVCFSGQTPPVLRLNWAQGQVRLRAPVRRGYWTWHFIDQSNSFYNWNGLPGAGAGLFDTTIAWMRGDTLSVIFSNATFQLAHGGPVALLSALEAASPAVRVTGRRIRWDLPADPGEALSWSLRDARGTVVRKGTGGPRGSLDAAGAPAGVYGMTFHGRGGAVRWEGRVVLP